MFEKGALIVYENSGVCRVEDITKLSGMGTGERLYYCLSQLGKDGGRIFCPVDNDKVTMRPILTEEEANRLIDEMPSIELLWVPNEKQRKETYRQAIAKCNYMGWVSIIKTLYLRGKARNQDGKKITVVDRQYLNLAKEYLYGELSVVFGMPIDEIEPMIIKRLDESEKIEVE